MVRVVMMTTNNCYKANNADQINQKFKGTKCQTDKMLVEQMAWRQKVSCEREIIEQQLISHK